MPLVQALDRLSTATGLSIGGATAIPPGLRSHAVRGRHSPAVTVRRMLEGTGLSAVKVDDHTYRLVADRAPPQPVPAPQAVAPSDIVVTATKRAQRLDTLGADVEVASFGSPLGDNAQRRDVVDLTAELPSLSTTRLGRGRDKLFLRGIADSSFSGKTEATLGEYLGEARINYNAPDPGLLLYDVRQIELLKGPQGTLYGGGTLGGVLRIDPERPDLDATGGFVDLAGSAMAHGDPGYAVAGMLNLPFASGRAGVRLLGYRRLDGGYIDDVKRGLRNVNRSAIDGGRVQFRVKLGDWTVDLLGTRQRIASADSDYAVKGLPPLSRASSVAQPSSNRFGLIDAEVHGSFGRIDLVSTTSVTRNDIQASYDATSLAMAPTRFADVEHIMAFNHETRISHSAPNGSGWIVGLSVYEQRDSDAQGAGGATLLNVDGNFRMKRLDAGGFAQTTLRHGALYLTAGLRGSYAATRTQTDLPLVEGAERHRGYLRASPMAEFGWSWRGTKLSLSYREGWRSGGSNVIGNQFHSVGPLGLYLTSYDPDHVRVVALGIGHRFEGSRPFDVQATLSGVDWDRIQSASIDYAGFVSTANAGSADLLNLDVTVGWRFRPDLSLRAGVSVTRAFTDSFFDDGLNTVFGNSGVVPSVPDLAGYASVEWTRPLGGDWTLGIEGRLSYLGRSDIALESGDPIPQGNVLSSVLAMRLVHGRYAASLEIENVADDRSNLFGYGNPFTLRSRRQATPQRPRTVTLGLHATF